MPLTAPIIGAIASVAGASYSIYSGEKAASSQKKAQKSAERSAKEQANAADQANNQANQRRSSSMASLSAAQQAGKSGVSGTMLTGAQGVDASQLGLGKSTLLGQ